MPVQTPGYKSGFAAPTRNRNYAYPSLWRGCIGAWCPSLGETGLVLKQHSGVGTDGTFNDMDEATAWVPSGGKTALEFDGVNDKVTTETNVLDGMGSVSLWLFSNSLSGASAAVYTGGSPASTWSGNIGTTSGGVVRSYISTHTFNIINGATITTNAWTHVCITWISGGEFAIYTDGIKGESLTIGNAYYSSSGAYWFGSNSGAFGQGMGGWWNGRLDDMRIYNRALTALEVSLLARRRAISYEPTLSRGYPVGAGPATNRRRRLICGANC